MNLFFQSLLTNTPVLAAFVVLFFMIKKQGFKIDEQGLKMEQGFKNVENEFKLVRAEMREGFLKVHHRLRHHDREIGRIKKKLKHRK